MDAHTLATLILSPFVLAFAYAGIHEYRRFKSEGSANYGLVYDEETGTTYVSGIAEHEDGFDPGEFDPSKYSCPESKSDQRCEGGAVTKAH